MFLKKVLHFLRLLHNDIKARVAKYLVTREVTRVLQLTHAQELAFAPRNEWALIKARQAQEIQAVRDGQQLDVIDRRSWAYPYLPEALHRLNQPILKNTPYNLRRFSETPIPRRAINLVKNALLSFEWQIKPISAEDQLTPDLELRIRIATESLKRPNNENSFRELLEAVLEDLIIGGYGCIEPRLTPYYKRPFKMWAVDGSTIRRFMDWTESTPDRPKYAQMTGLKGERGIVTFLDNELIYIRDNVRTSTPFGLGKLEVAFNTVNAFLGAQDMSGRAGADQIHKTFLWWEQALNPVHIQTVRRYIQNEQEGQAKISLVQGAKAPTVIDVQAVNPEDLLLDWQQFLIKIIANAFDLSPLALGIDQHTNRATGQVMADSDFRSAVVPMAKRVEEAITRFLLHGFLGWKDIEFEFIGLEDPDAITRTIIQQREYMMNALTPDEIRESNSLPPLPGGWGRLTMYQMGILMQEVAGRTGGKAGAAMGSRMGGGMGSSGMGGGFGSGSMMPGSGGAAGLGSSMGSGSSMNFSAYDVAQLTPDEIQMYQELGLLPPTSDLANQMEQQAPGILDTLTDELQDFFTKTDQVEEESQIQPAPITSADEREQMQRFQEGEHQESLAEKMINRRGVFGPAVNQQITKNAERGKYPRSGGRYPLANSQYKPGISDGSGVSEAPKKNQMPKKGSHYRAGRNNPYK